MKVKAYAVVVTSNNSIFEYSDGGGGHGDGPLIERCLQVNASEDGANAALKFLSEEGEANLKVVPVEIEY